MVIGPLSPGEGEGGVRETAERRESDGGATEEEDGGDGGGCGLVHA